ncbi:MAG: hypothetical protein KGI50_03455 [Patescibacteria group bacterium]|nr:hypothetical protein [Patescibacteria group bacterium]MDE2438348.1 hypothetical protein [Patescibacteria group bacterium]
MLGRACYIRMIGLFTFLVSSAWLWGALMSYHMILNLHTCLTALLICASCVMVLELVESRVVRVVAVGGMSVVLGFVSGPLIAHHETGGALESSFVAMLVVSAASGLIILYPALAEKWRPYFLMALTFVAVYYGNAHAREEIAKAMKCPHHHCISLNMWWGIVIFILYTAYGWVRGLRQSHTFENALIAGGGVMFSVIHYVLRGLAWAVRLVVTIV